MAKKKQPHLPGTAPKSIPQLDERAAAYRDLHDERMTIQRKENDARGDLMASMRELERELERDASGRPVYHYVDGEECFVVEWAEEKIKVRKQKADEPLPGAEVG